jgi:hypothetical protein
MHCRPTEQALCPLMPPFTRLRLDAVLLCEAFLGVPLGDRLEWLWRHGGRSDPDSQLQRVFLDRF